MKLRLLFLLFATILCAGCGVTSQTRTGSNAGGLSFDVVPSSARIFVDGSIVGEARDFDGEDAVLEISSGRHIIEIKAEGCRPYYKDHYSSYAVTKISVMLQCQ